MKKKTIYKAAIAAVALIALGWLTTLPSTTRQAINYQLREIRIPLYLKTIDFLDRHLNYRWTVDQITSRTMSDDQKVEEIFQWTIRRISRQPKELPIIDDHVWHIIVRGYGVPDQMVDVFATISNYAGLKAFILYLEGSGNALPDKICLGAVYFNGAWHICDLHQKTEFVNGQGRWATISEIISGKWQRKTRDHTFYKERSPDYQNYFQSLHSIDFDYLYQGSRSSIQSPVKRFMYFFRGEN